MNKQVCTNKMGHILALLGIVLLLAGVFLPYMTAVGEMAEYIDQNPERMELASENLTAGDLKNIPITRTGKLITGVYGEDDGLAATVILLVLGGLGALTALVAALKKPIGALIYRHLRIPQWRNERGFHRRRQIRMGSGLLCNHRRPGYCNGRSSLDAGNELRRKKGWGIF